MIVLSQKNRQARIDTPLGEDVLLLQSFDGVESMSRGFEYTANVVSKDPAIDGNAIVGKRVSITYFSEEGKEKVFNGFVSRFEFSEQIEQPVPLAAYQVTIVPWLWFLNHNRDCRIFQDTTVPDIVKKIFRDRGFTDFDPQLSENYERREYCVQYQESDFDFVSRLMEEEGIFYYFKHTAEKHVMVMSDSTSGYYDLEVEQVQFTPIGQAHEKQLSQWRHVYEFRPKKFTQKDFDFKNPNDGLIAETRGKAAFEGCSELEIFEYPGRYVDESTGKRLAEVRSQELESEFDQVIGAGPYLQFAVGGKFTVDKHIRNSESGQQFALLEVRTSFASNFGFDEDSDDDFNLTFRCIPASTVYRPTRATPKPIMDGPQTAIVVTDGQEIVVDEHARVKVQFHWDRYGTKDINSSCWIRVSQSHAGSGWGGIDIPRKDEEVIVSFLNGDPDQPIITGRVYNGKNQPPFNLSGAGTNAKNKTRRGNTTKTYEGDGYNELTMDDAKGKEQIRIHAQRNMDTVIENDETWTVRNDRTKVVNNDENNTIGNHRKTIIAKGNETQEVQKGDRKVTVATGQNSLTVQKDHVVTVKEGNLKHVVESGNHTILAKKEAHITGEEKLIAIGNKEVSVSGKKVSITGTDEVVIGVGNNSIVINKQGISIGGTKITSAAIGVHEISGALIKIN